MWLRFSQQGGWKAGEPPPLKKESPSGGRSAQKCHRTTLLWVGRDRGTLYGIPAATKSCVDVGGVKVREISAPLRG